MTDPIRARLYDADGRDEEVDLTERSIEDLADRQLLWVDVDRTDTTALAAAVSMLGITQPLARRLSRTPTRADLTQHPDMIHLVVMAVDAPSAETDDPTPVARAIDVVGGHGWVLTVHEGAVDVFDRLDAATEGETLLGSLDAAGFVASICDEVLAGYFSQVEDIEREIDRLDEQALRGQKADHVLASIVRLRRRIGILRRTLAPHRLAFAALARPEMELHEGFGRPWPGLHDRLERAIDAVESLRDSLLGTFDIHMGRAAQDANEVMKVLTIVSAVLLPAVVLAGIMGMNFGLTFFDTPENFWIVLVSMAAFALAILATARMRGWL